MLSQQLAPLTVSAEMHSTNPRREPGKNHDDNQYMTLLLVHTVTHTHTHLCVLTHTVHPVPRHPPPPLQHTHITHVGSSLPVL